MQGLLASGKTEICSQSIFNLLHLLKIHGSVPNGTRKYYTSRSQPPLLSEMIRSLLSDSCVMETRHLQLLASAAPILEQEFVHWTTGLKSVTVEDGSGRSFTLSRYYADVNEQDVGPRPEAYKQDVELVTWVRLALQGIQETFD